MIPFFRNDRSCKINGFTAYYVLFLASAPTLGGAKPIGHVKRQSSSSGIQMWVPIVSIVVILVAVGFMYWARRRLRSGLERMAATAMATSAGQDSPATREVTADQLAGRTPVATQRRRSRRNRRTPSQISTASLPLYMKEPGAQELVIFRGQDPEDNPNIAVAMPAVAEDGEGNVSQSSLYGNVPDSPPNMSLIHGDESLDPTHDRSTRPLLPPNSTDIPLRESFNTVHTARDSEDSASSLLPAVQHGGDDFRGEAPPYFEVVDSGGNGGTRQEMGSSVPPEASSDAPRTVGSRPNHDPETRENRNSRRLSGLRNFLHTFTNPSARPAVSTIPQEPSQRSIGHTRGDSNMSVTSSSTHDSRMPYTRDRATSRASHRPSNSGSGTGIHSAFRPLSRQRSQTTMHSTHLNSPSMISINSISAPLSHTLTRTEISYPASGPTAEQMRLISSRESFARFAVPYGPAAIAFAASTSRHDLEPTPDYESHAPAPTAQIVSPSYPLDPVVSSPVEDPQLPSEVPQPFPDPSSSQGQPEAHDANPEALSDVKTNSEEPNSVVNTEPLPSPAQALPVAAPVSQNATAAAQVVSASASATSKSPLPPSAFRINPSPLDVRAQSRASSMASTTSFATAEEFMYDSAPSGTGSPEAPSTPQGTSFHTRQTTDTPISEVVTPVATQFTTSVQ